MIKNNLLPRNCLGKKLNSPFQSQRQFKKLQVCIKDEDNKIKNIHFGDKRYEDYTMHKDKLRRINFRARHKCDLVKPNKSTARYWSCKRLW